MFCIYSIYSCIYIQPLLIDQSPWPDWPWLCSSTNSGPSEGKYYFDNSPRHSMSSDGGVIKFLIASQHSATGVAPLDRMRRNNRAAGTRRFEPDGQQRVTVVSADEADTTTSATGFGRHTGALQSSIKVRVLRRHENESEARSESSPSAGMPGDAIKAAPLSDRRASSNSALSKRFIFVGVAPKELSRKPPGLSAVGKKYAFAPVVLHAQEGRDPTTTAVAVHDSLSSLAA